MTIEIYMIQLEKSKELHWDIQIVCTEVIFENHHRQGGVSPRRMGWSWGIPGIDKDTLETVTTRQRVRVEGQDGL